MRADLVGAPLQTGPDDGARPADGVGDSGRERTALWSQTLFLLVGEWKILLAGAALAAAAAGLVLFFLPPSYRAEVLIVPTRARTAVEFEPKIKTVDSNTAAATLSAERRQAYADLVKNSDIETRVITQLSGTVPAGGLVPSELIEQVRGSLKPKSELIAVEAQASRPEDAVAIANAWGAAFVEQVNRIYAGSPDSLASRATLEAQRNEVRSQYDVLQAALVAHTLSSRVEELDHQIQERVHTIGLLRFPFEGGAIEASVSPVSGSDAATRGQAAAATTAGARTNLEDFRIAEARVINDFAQIHRRLQSTRQAVLALAYQAETGGLGPSDAAALAILKAQLVGLGGGLPSQVQFQLPVATSPESPSSLRALVGSIDRAIQDVGNELEVRRTAYEEQRLGQLTSLEEDLRTLRAEREAAQGIRRDLTQRRDLAWDSYSALSRKVEERTVAESTSGRELELATRAAFAEPVSKRTSIIVPIAALIGLCVAAGVVVLRTYAPALTAARLSRQRWAEEPV